MATNPSQPSRKRNQISLVPLTPVEALAGLLKAKLDDVKKLEAADRKKKGVKK